MPPDKMPLRLASIKTGHNVTESTSMVNKDYYIPPVKIINRSYLSGDNFLSILTIFAYKLNVYVFSFLSVSKACSESLQMFLSLQIIISLVSSCSHAIYAVKSVVNEYCGMLSGGIIILSGSPCAIAPDKKSGAIAQGLEHTNMSGCPIISTTNSIEGQRKEIITLLTVYARWNWF